MFLNHTKKFESLLTGKEKSSHNLEKISKVLELGSNKEKIEILETLDNIDNQEILDKIISKLNDDDMQVRGEAFSSLLLNRNKISGCLIDNLTAASKNIRGFVCLILANRDETIAVPEIIKLAKDEHAMVRSCALGALSHLKARKAKEVFLKGAQDSNLDVRKSALQAIIDLEIPVSEEKINEILKEGDSEIEKMISLITKQVRKQ